MKLSNREAIFPTATKFGMAALLPHKGLSAQARASGQLEILADGQPADAGNRDQVLKMANQKSVALRYEDIIRLKRAERKFDSRATYYLVIADESGMQLSQKEEFQIDIAFAVHAFNR